MTLLDKCKSLIYASRLDGTKRKNDAPFLSFTSEITVAWTIEVAADGFVSHCVSQNANLSVNRLPTRFIDVKH